MFERADWLDAAADLAAAERDASIRRIRAPTPERRASSICVDCGDEIGEARRAALPHARRCFDCQTICERKGR